MKYIILTKLFTVIGQKIQSKQFTHSTTQNLVKLTDCTMLYLHLNGWINAAVVFLDIQKYFNSV